MALPKYKMSRANTHTRRSAWKATPVTTIACKSCGAPTRPHTVCPNCGAYRGRNYSAAVDPRLAE